MYIFICAIVFIIILSKILVKRPKNFPNGPPLYPFLGNLPNFDIHNAAEESLRLHKIYGDFSIIAPFYKVIVLKSVNLINEVFLSNKFIGRPTVAFNKDRFFGKNLGLILSEGDAWQKNKKFVIYHMKNLGAGTKRQELVVHDELYRILDYIDAHLLEPFDIKKLFYFVHINVSWTLLGGSRFDHSDPKMHQLANSLEHVGHYFTIFGGGITSIIPILRKFFPTINKYDQFLKQHQILNDLCKEVIENHMLTRMPNNPRDLVDNYLDEMSKSKTSKDVFNIDTLTSIYADSMLGGADTGTVTLSFSVMMLALHPEKQQKLIDEIKKEIGQDRLPSTDDIINLPYAEAVFNETLRYRPAVSLILGHRAIEDTILGEYEIPKNTLVFPHMEAAFFDETVWDNPNEFRPERFINEDGSFKRMDLFSPFGKGKRVCPGERQAKMANVIILAALYQKYKFSFPEEDGPPNTNLIRKFLSACPSYRIVATPITINTK